MGRTLCNQRKEHRNAVKPAQRGVAGENRRAGGGLRRKGLRFCHSEVRKKSPFEYYSTASGAESNCLQTGRDDKPLIGTTRL